MGRNDIIANLKKYFNIKELVCPDVYSRFGEGAWRYFDTSLLHALLILRTQILNVPMTVNNGSSFTQRGLRCNCCQLVKTKKNPYLSSHIFGKGVDFDAKGMTAEQVRQKIKANLDLFPFPIRLEEGVNWVHFDVIDMGNGKKLTTFTE